MLRFLSQLLWLLILTPQVVPAQQPVLDTAVTSDTLTTLDEWIPVAPGEESLPRPGMVVGLAAGVASLETANADALGVVTVANAGAARVRVRMIGRAQVLARGPVRVGEVLQPSGLGDGLAAATLPLRARDLVLGIAWEALPGGGEGRVEVLIGPWAEQQVQRARLESLEAQLDAMLQWPAAARRRWDGTDLPHAREAERNLDDSYEIYRRNRPSAIIDEMQERNREREWELERERRRSDRQNRP